MSNNNNNIIISAAVGATSPAKAATVTATGPAAIAATSSHPLMHDIANCVIVKAPPGSSPEQVLLALDKQFPSLAGAMPSLIKGQRALRFPKGTDQHELVATGLIGVELFNQKIAEYGTVLKRRAQYVGKTKHIAGVYDFVLALKDRKVLPPAYLTLERDGVTERIPLRITGGMRHCVFCRSSEHVRKECTVAPVCKICKRTSHATQHCPDRHVSGSQGPQTSRASPAAPPPPSGRRWSSWPPHGRAREVRPQGAHQDWVSWPPPGARPHVVFP
ncbi:BQ2448_6987 [Microbotryum intermedium]|uniref:BQ2448_6987 protein n=1 Tax=Microbotryum intermedium TaxID=269621 RepID=A0A238FGX1_9BASI|nr:BQ2448_6987 [Microbotryum intermedium]